MKFYWILFSACCFLVHNAYGMQINIIDNDGYALIEHPITEDACSKFSVLKESIKAAVDLEKSQTEAARRALQKELEERGATKYTTRTVTDAPSTDIQANIPPLPIKLEDVQNGVLKYSGLSVDKAHIKNALKYLDQQEQRKWNTLGRHTTAAALFLSRSWDLTDRQIQQELSNAALETGYVDVACKHITKGYIPPKSWYQRCIEYMWPKNTPDNGNNDPLESLITLIESTESEKLTAGLSNYLEPATDKQLCESMYSSSAWYELQKKIQKKRWFTYFDKDINVDAVASTVDVWRNASITRLFDTLHRNSIGREMCTINNIDYAQDFKALFTALRKQNSLEIPQEKRETIFSGHDLYLLGRPFSICGTTNNDHFGVKRDRFAHLPALYLLKKLNNTYYHGEKSYYHCDDIKNLMICKADKQILKTISGDAPFYPLNDILTVISFRRCNLTKLPLNLYKYPTLCWYFTENELNKETKDSIKSVGYDLPINNMLNSQGTWDERGRYTHPHGYLVKPHYWKWLNTAMVLFYTTLIVVWIYRDYKNTVETNALVPPHLLTRADEVKNRLAGMVTVENADAYRFALAGTSIDDKNLETIFTSTLNSIRPLDPNVAVDRTGLTLSLKNYALARESIATLETSWKHNSSPQGFSYKENIFLASLFFYWTAYPALASLGWNESPVRPETSILFYGIPYMVLNSPFLLPELILGLNRDRYTVVID
jgi:hypothetical protein